MANIGILGAGKLGLPVALTFESKGHDVLVSDVNPAVGDYLATRAIPYQEADIQSLLNNTKIARVALDKLVSFSNLLFVAVQTPHDPKFEGSTRLPEERKDFDYSFIKAAVGSVAVECARQQKHTDVVVISTMLPGTTERELRPVLNEYVHLAYEPMFIAMGTVIHDVLNPEFTLIGVDEPEVANRLEAFHKTIHNAPALRTDITTAEAIKVSYNTWITAKTVIANIWGEIADKTGANFADIYKAWGLATDRLISTKYMKAGMGDGGGCHPRDNIALSWLAKEIGLSHNVFEDLMQARENYEDYHARQCIKASTELGLPLVVLGKSFKPETNIETGSAAVLLGNILKEYGYPFIQAEEIEIVEPAVVFIATDHERYKNYRFPEGSVIISPFK